MNIAEMTKHIRGRIKFCGIDARVRVAPGGGSIQVICPAFDRHFNGEEQRQIRLIASTNSLTLVRGQPIDIERNTDPMQMDFYLNQKETTQ